MRAINPVKLAAPLGGYSHALVAPEGARLMFVSGQIPERPDGTVPDTFEAQCHTVWDNIAAILEAANATFSDVVKITTFLARREDADANGAIRRRYLGTHAPALTVIIAKIYDPLWLLEIEAIAVIPSNLDSA